MQPRNRTKYLQQLLVCASLSFDVFRFKKKKHSQYDISKHRVKIGAAQNVLQSKSICLVATEQHTVDLCNHITILTKMLQSRHIWLLCPSPSPSTRLSRNTDLLHIVFGTGKIKLSSVWLWSETIKTHFLLHPKYGPKTSFSHSHSWKSFFEQRSPVIRK